jgi:sugar phosphate isomerase/epimerase
MRIAFSTLAFPEASLGAAVAVGRECGYEGIELRLIDGELIDPRMSPSDRAAVKRTVQAANLPVAAVDSSIRLTDAAGDPGSGPGGSPGPGGSRGPGAELRAFLELASEWEAPVVRVFGGALAEGGPARRDGLKAAARVLEEAAPVASGLGVTIGVETHDSFSASATVAELLSMVDSPVIGAVWDSHHPHRMGEHPSETYRNIGDRLLLAQVKDAKRAPGRADGWQLVLLGDGEVPVRLMLGLLATGGYQGWVSVEWEKRWHPEIEPPELALPQHIKLLRGLLREVA